LTTCFVKAHQKARFLGTESLFSLTLISPDSLEDPLLKEHFSVYQKVEIKGGLKKYPRPSLSLLGIYFCYCGRLKKRPGRK